MHITRREALQRLALTAGISAVLPWRQTRAAEPQRLDVNDPAAVAQGGAGNSYRPCSLFPGKVVSVGGWCKGWTAEM
jgi:High potential iron-sulfur protein